ncbi:MAG TPA: hypothetical protein VEC60_05415 [Reyranella sp.]|nr:hypothetical protein [Reyranella sp.]
MRLFVVVTVAALAACSGETPTPEASATPTEAAPTAAVEATATPAVAAPEAPPLRTIPAAFHGRWGLVPADCTSTRGDAKGLMTVTADAVRFYESVARPVALTLVGERRIDGNFAATGEGQTWTLLQRLELSANGRTLTRTVDEGDSAPAPGGNSFVYTRCPE